MVSYKIHKIYRITTSIQIEVDGYVISFQYLDNILKYPKGQNQNELMVELQEN